MTVPIPCPACLHNHTLAARLKNEEPCYDDFDLMRWRTATSGAMGQQVTAAAMGAWVCDACSLRLTTMQAGTLLDAALMHAFPDCDSITPEGIHADTQRALAGGPR